MAFKNRYPDKTIWCYTGYVWKKVKHRSILNFIDVVVDGPFVEAEKDLGLRFRGSRNQRIIDVQKSLESGAVILREDLME
jgi:anaerobic ribonucleoside-triphosphate reductase activating protein